MWLGVALLLLFGVLTYYGKWRSKAFPPGPPAFPIIGNLLVFRSLVKKTGFYHLAVERLAEKYGPIIGMQLGAGPPTVFITGFEYVTEALNKVELDGRPNGFVVRFRTMGKRRGVLATDGELWQTQRRFLLRNLRDFGFGKKSMERIIQDEAASLVKYLEELAMKNPDGVSFQDALTLPVLNSLWNITAGSRHEVHDSVFQNYIRMQGNFTRKNDSSGGLINMFPWLRFICPEASGFNRVKQHHIEMWDFFKGVVKQHEATYQDSESRDLIDVYLREIRASYKRDDTFSEDQLISVLKDLFAAGSDTTSNTLSFFFLYMLLHPRVQSKVQEEIDNVIGWEKLPSTDDRKKMPYLSAVILETQRISNIGPFTLPHRALENTAIGGYTVPKDSTVLMSIYSVHMDKKYWKNPEMFLPERFIDNNGAFHPNSHVIPFGIGHRRCLGETLAKNSLFIFAAVLLQYFHVLPVPDQSEPTTKPQAGLTLIPHPYNAIFKKRRDHSSEL